MLNSEIKKQIKENGFAIWQVAEQIGVCDMTLSRWLRSEKDHSKQVIILNALNELTGGVNND